MTRTTQSEFHSMRGHVSQGCEVRMENGDLMIVKSTMNGWQLFDKDGRPFSTPTHSAHVLECIVFSYPRDIGP